MKTTTKRCVRMLIAVSAAVLMGMGLVAPRLAIAVQSDATYQLDKEYVLQTRGRDLDAIENSYVGLREIIVERGMSVLGPQIAKLDETVGEAYLLYEILQDTDRDNWISIHHTLDRKINRARTLSNEIGKAIDSRI